MELTEIQFNLADYLESKFAHPDRSSGLHLSHIYGDLNRALGKQKENGFNEEDLDEFAQIGFLWERILEHYLAELTALSDPGRFMRLGELRSAEGVVMTPDYLDLDFLGNGSCELGLEEWKVTWRSVRQAENLEQNHWKWLVQIKGYCRELGTRRARLRALYLVGNWRDRIVPTPKCWEMEFTPRELEDNWEMLMGHARRKGWLINAKPKQ